ncbi:hypothetical protein CAPTEDRAFT_213631 [Capitella teleta]|uniref:Uncharacterized protein n=1 Tax=Capitella teleta TaxID=283909 RepID=R7VJ91_CAPTE|nr:hypothetical protein CAPTEDRAFT_213631 [Capitella teleta]|eukprot:ELU16411.1 hypothetical protein CAPTEDRAFT_213631 [Capitella teleta]
MNWLKSGGGVNIDWCKSAHLSPVEADEGQDMTRDTLKERRGKMNSREKRWFIANTLVDSTEVVWVQYAYTSRGKKQVRCLGGLGENSIGVKDRTDTLFTGKTGVIEFQMEITLHQYNHPPLRSSIRHREDSESFRQHNFGTE